VKTKTFLDTNILVYADDLDAGDKNERALDIVERGVATGNAVVSTQVLQEYFVNATGKFGMDPDLAQRKVVFFTAMHVVRIGVEDILAAIDLHRLHQLSFWDALIVSCAAASGCRLVLTEDLQHGQVLAGVRIENPFRDLE
jgi:predicted nucleic acid-binding protein